MVLDIQRFREEKGGNPEEVRQCLRDRYKDVTLADRVVKADAEWRQCKLTICIGLYSSS